RWLGVNRNYYRLDVGASGSARSDNIICSACCNGICICKNYCSGSISKVSISKSGCAACSYCSGSKVNGRWCAYRSRICNYNRWLGIDRNNYRLDIGASGGACSDNIICPAYCNSVRCTECDRSGSVREVCVSKSGRATCSYCSSSKVNSAWCTYRSRIIYHYRWLRIDCNNHRLYVGASGSACSNNIICPTRGDSICVGKNYCSGSISEVCVC